MRYTTVLPLLASVCGLLTSACSSDEDKRPCPPGGIGVADYDGKSIVEQIAEYKQYACSKPQICPDRGGQAGAYPIAPSNEAAEASFLLTNCTTGKEKLEVTKVVVYGDERCVFTNVTDKEIERKSVLPGESTAIRTTYKPTTPGEDHAELRIYSNAENYPVLRLRICSVAFVEGPEPDAGPAPQPAGDGGAAVPADGGGQADSMPALECKATETQNATCHPGA